MKLKHILIFESFKLNEEVPYNFEVGEEYKDPTWTPEEISDLKKLGADEIEKNTATFIEENGLIIKISKLTEKKYLAESNAPILSHKRKRLFNKIGSGGEREREEVPWKEFLARFHRFVMNDGVYGV